METTFALVFLNSPMCGIDGAEIYTMIL